MNKTILLHALARMFGVGQASRRLKAGKHHTDTGVARARQPLNKSQECARRLRQMNKQAIA